MKLLYRLLILIITIKLNNSQSFQSNKCVDAGNECTTYGDDKCIKGYSCQFSNPNNSDSKTICKPELKLGEKCPTGVLQFNICEDGQQCFSRNESYSTDLYCNYHSFAGVGEKCQHNFDCKGRFNNLICSKGFCAFNKNSWPGNQKCRLPYSCQGQSYCTSTSCDLDEKNNCKSNPQCKPLEKVGSKCIDSRDCSLGTHCLYKKVGEYGVCSEKYILKLNQSCITSLECDIGLVCNSNICTKRTITNSGSCIHTGCNEYNEYCDIKSNECVFKTIHTQTCKNAEIQRNKCYQLHNCPFSNIDPEFSFPIKLSCMIKNCEQETNNYFQQCSSLFNTHQCN